MPFDALERRRAEISRHRENSARRAEVSAKFETVGAGAKEFEDRIDFGLTYTEEPHVAYGSALDLDHLAELLDLAPGTDPPLPLCSGMVTDWDRDDRDFYVGAWVAVRVFFPEAVTVDELVMSHYFTFSAIAIKDIPTEGEA